jgi:hypothetical protein
MAILRVPERASEYKKRKSLTGHVTPNLAIYNEKNKQSQYKIASRLVIKGSQKFTFGFKRLGLPKQKAQV